VSECEHHGHCGDGADPDAWNRAREEAWRNPFPGATPETCIAALDDVMRGTATPARTAASAAPEPRHFRQDNAGRQTFKGAGEEGCQEAQGGLMAGRLYQPCLPTCKSSVPAGKDWLHEIKHDGYRPDRRAGWQARAAVHPQRLISQLAGKCESSRKIVGQ
jgi:hypothetical protein